jgi:hypothetical protein
VQSAAAGQATVFKKALWAPAGVGVGRMRHLVPFQATARVPALEFPTAMHADADVQDTPFRPPPPCRGLGVVWIRHRAPSHRSARVVALGVKAFAAPTAVHADADVQDTPLKNPRPCGGLGVVWMVHRAPSHASASAPPLKPPVAVQADAEAHDTAFRDAPPCAGAGVFWRCQAAPFHRSTKAWVTPATVLVPTAVQAAGELHATPARAAKVDRGGFGVRTIRQELPFHCSARLAPWPEVLICTPTAMQEFDAGHDTQNS